VCVPRVGAEVKDKKNFLGVYPVTPTVTNLFTFLCGGVTLGTTAGTLEVKCEGHNPAIDATKVELKK
jgi:hypothetical protein